MLRQQRTPALPLAALVMALAALVHAEAKPTRSCLRERAPRPGSTDPQAVRIHRDGLQSVLDFVRARPDLFPARATSSPRMLNRHHRDTVRAAWKALLDYTLALEEIGRPYHRHRRVRLADPEPFLVPCAAFLARYRFALEFIALCRNDSCLHALLNEPVPEAGLPAGTYDRFVNHFMDPRRIVEFRSLLRAYRDLKRNPDPLLRRRIERDAAAVAALMPRPGPLLDLRNALRKTRQAARAAWFPLQTWIATWMGDTQYLRPGSALITEAQIHSILRRLRPGDIMLQRREWFISNLAAPGFWTHGVLYVGTPMERRAFFDDAEIKEWVRGQGRRDGDLDALLYARYPQAYARSVQPSESGPIPRILEAVSEGAVFTSIEHSAAADSIAVLRPRLPKSEIAVALLRAFHLSGRPYDFNFDFVTDSSLTCTELLHKTYEPGENLRGLRMPLGRIAGRVFMTANDIARQFDKNYRTRRQQMDFVLFLDGHEAAGRAVNATLHNFRATWKRSTWHVLRSRDRRPRRDRRY